MTSFTSSGKTDPRAGGSHRRRGWFRAVSGVHLLILASGVLALVINLVLLRSGEEPLTRVAMIGIDLAPGRTLGPEDIQLIPVDVAEPVASNLVSEAELGEYQGWVITRQISAGSLLTKGGLRSPLTTVGLRAMSFPIDADHAVGGDLVPGDVVDVIRVDEKRASFVATAVHVLAVPTQSEGALGLSGGGFHLVLEVDDRTALALALALANAQVEVLRSTGSDPVEVRLLDEAPAASEGSPLTADTLVGSDAEVHPGTEGYLLSERGPGP